MPLISLCGGPLSGKTTVTKKIVEYVRAKYPDTEIRVINLESLNLNRNDIYKDMNSEKKFNSMIRTLVERTLTVKRLVILDMPNLYKGFRYELYTRVNAANTCSCVVFCDTPMEDCVPRNASGIYEDKLFNDIWNRFEDPLDTCRWELPLWRISPSMPVDDAMIQQIVGSVLERKDITVSVANTSHNLQDSTYVQMIDQVTRYVTEQIVTRQKQQGYGVGTLMTWDPLTLHIPIISTKAATSTQNMTATATTNTNNTNTTTTTTTTTDNATTTSSAPPTTSSAPGSGFKFMKKKQPATETTRGIDMSITLRSPATTDTLLALRKDFTKTAALMHLKTPTEVMTAFIEFLSPRL